MSTIKANKLEHISTSNGGIQLDNAGHVTVDGVQMPSAGPLSNRNLVVNGAFQVDQRNAGSSITCSSGETKYPADRAKFMNLGTGELVLTVQQVTDAPAGFRNSVKATVTTAESSGSTPAADDRASLQLRLEGNTVESLALGTSDAKDFVVSFYVKSSQTGNFGVAFAGVDRSYAVLYNIASADTWERKVIKVPGPTDGSWNAGSSQGFAIKFGLYTGSDRDGPDQGTDGTGTWQTNAVAQGTENQVQLGGTANATWQITGVQLEVGEEATPFEHRIYGDELAKCQRYYYRAVDGSRDNYHPICTGTWYNTTQLYGTIDFPVEMRVTPSLLYSANSNTAAFKCFGAGVSSTTDDIATQADGTTMYSIYFYNLSAQTAGNGGWAELNNESGAYIAFQSEL